MKFRRTLTIALLVIMFTVHIPPTHAGLGDFLKSIKKAAGFNEDLSESKIIDGLKEALEIGIQNAVKLVSRSDGYYGNPEIRIPLPGIVRKAEQALRMVGFGPQIDAFLLSMNRAAEEAAPEAEALFRDTIKKMSFEDARKILQGRDDEATRYFKEKTWDRLARAFMPIVHGAMSRVGVTRAYQQLDAKAKLWDDLVKIGRTHLMDATPIRVGQVFSGYARQAEWSIDRADWAIKEILANMPIGGTAVGTGINTHPQFARRVCAALSDRLGVQFQEAANHPEAQAAKDSFVSAHGHLKTIAVSLSKIANDIRHLGSGPRCGIGELILPAIQPGSSIMPGKVNPVLCESVIQVACRVIGNDATITTAALGGVGSIFELNVAMPVMIDAFLESVKLLANVASVFADKLLKDLQVNEERCRELLDQSLMMVTSLAPVVGYDQAAAIAKKAHAEGKTIRQLVLAEKLIPEDELNELLDPDKMTRPG